MNILKPTILTRLKNLNRAELERIAKECVVESIPISQLRAMANNALKYGDPFPDDFPKNQIGRDMLVIFVMNEVVKPMPFKKLCSWIKRLANKAELKEVL